MGGGVPAGPTDWEMSGGQEFARGHRPEKPPLGVEPRWLWLEIRAKDLVDAICRYAEVGGWESAAPWIKELAELVDDPEWRRRTES